MERIKSYWKLSILIKMKEVNKDFAQQVFKFITIFKFYLRIKNTNDRYREIIYKEKNKKYKINRNYQNITKHLINRDLNKNDKKFEFYRRVNENDYWYEDSQDEDTIVLSYIYYDRITKDTDVLVFDIQNE